MAETKAPTKTAPAPKAAPTSTLDDLNTHLMAVANLCDAHAFRQQAIIAISSARTCSPQAIIQFAQLGEIAVDARRKAPKGDKDRIEGLITEAYEQLSKVAIQLFKQNCKA